MTNNRACDVCSPDKQEVFGWVMLREKWPIGAACVYSVWSWAQDVIRVVSYYESCPPDETQGASWFSSHDRRSRKWMSRHSATPVGLSVCLHSCTEQLYIRLSTWSIFLVFVCQKILHLYLQQLNRGQLSTCVVWWWVLEFDASRSGKAF